MNLLQIQHGTTTLTIHGAGRAAPFHTAALEARDSAAGLARDDLTLALRGSPAEIESGLAALIRLLEAAAPAWAAPGQAKVYLLARVGSSGTAWRSPIHAARVELLGGGAVDRVTGSQGVRIAIERAGWWEESAESALYLATQATSRTHNAVTLRNHWDSAHSNWAQAEADDVRGELPAPLRLEFISAGLANHGTLYCGHNASSSPWTMITRLEGEAAAFNGAAVDTVSLSGASNNAYGRVTWSGTAAAALQWTVASTLLNLGAGEWFLPVARLALKLQTGEWWGRWKLVYPHAGGTSVLWESRPTLLDPARGLQPGAPLRLPPWIGSAAEVGLALVWEVTPPGSASHTLAVDYLYLLALESWRIYRPALVYASGFAVYDEPASASLLGPGGLRAHTAEGPGLVAVPGKQQRWYFLAETSAGDDAPEATSTLRLWYRPRKRVL